MMMMMMMMMMIGSSAQYYNKSVGRIDCVFQYIYEIKKTIYLKSQNLRVSQFIVSGLGLGLGLID